MKVHCPHPHQRGGDWQAAWMGEFSLGDFITAIGLAFVIEGLMFLAFPEGVRRMMTVVAASPTQQMRIAGVISAVLGLAVVWFIRG